MTEHEAMAIELWTRIHAAHEMLSRQSAKELLPENLRPLYFAVMENLYQLTQRWNMPEMVEGQMGVIGRGREWDAETGRAIDFPDE